MKPSLAEAWFNLLRVMPSPRVLEIGTGAWDGRPAVHYRNKILAANKFATWRGLDVKAGDDVHIVADLHDLSGITERFDAVFFPSVLEHVRRPWIVAGQLMSICNQGAVLMTQSHQAFPIHKYPEDYWRFTVEALVVLFGDAGWEVIDTNYTHPAKVIPLVNECSSTNWNFAAEAYLNCEILARKP